MGLQLPNIPNVTSKNSKTHRHKKGRVFVQIASDIVQYYPPWLVHVTLASYKMDNPTYPTSFPAAKQPAMAFPSPTIPGNGILPYFTRAGWWC